MKQDDLLINPEKEKIKAKDIEKAKKNAENSLNVPAGYIPIRLSTKGKLGLPEILHFRNFDIEEIIELASIQDDDEKYFSLVKCLQNMVAEDIDISNAHEKELTEILYFIHIGFNGLEIGPYRYYLNEDIEDDYLKNDKNNLGEISFNPQDLNITNIMDKFKEPIKITYKDQLYKFRLIRVKDTLMAKEYVIEKYKQEKEDFVKLEYILQHNSNPHIKEKIPVSSKEEKAYKEYQKRRLSDFTKVLFASVLIGDNEKDYTFEESLNKLQNKEIPLDYWIKYEEIAKSLEFGLDNLVKFICPINKKSIARRFLFQTFDFLPSMESKSSSEYAVSFGD